MAATTLLSFMLNFTRGILIYLCSFPILEWFLNLNDYKSSLGVSKYILFNYFKFWNLSNIIKKPRII